MENLCTRGDLMSLIVYILLYKREINGKNDNLKKIMEKQILNANCW